MGSTIRTIGDLSDHDRFEDFYFGVLPMVYGYLWRRSGGRDDVARELSEATFTEAVHQLHSGTAFGEPVAWVVALARRQLANHHHSQGERGAVRPPPAGSCLQRSEIRHRQARLVLALESLPARDQLILQLRYVDDWPLSQVADLLNLPSHVTESLVNRARQALVDKYGTHIDAELSVLDQLRLLTDPPIDPPVAFQNQLLERIHVQFLAEEDRMGAVQKAERGSATMQLAALSSIVSGRLQLK